MEDNTVIGLFERTLNNCRFYQEKKMCNHLLNEIGVLRGIAYVLDLTGACPHTDEFMYFINIQEELRSLDNPS